MVAPPPAIAIVPAPVSVPPKLVDGPEKVSVPVAAFTVPAMSTNETETTSLPVPAVFSNRPQLMKDDAVESAVRDPAGVGDVPGSRRRVDDLADVPARVADRDLAALLGQRVWRLKSENVPPIDVARQRRRTGQRQVPRPRG